MVVVSQRYLWVLVLSLSGGQVFPTLHKERELEVRSVSPAVVVEVVSAMAQVFSALASIREHFPTRKGQEGGKKVSPLAVLRDIFQVVTQKIKRTHSTRSGIIEDKSTAQLVKALKKAGQLEGAKKLKLLSLSAAAKKSGVQEQVLRKFLANETLRVALVMEVISVLKNEVQKEVIDIFQGAGTRSILGVDEIQVTSRDAAWYTKCMDWVNFMIESLQFVLYNYIVRAQNTIDQAVEAYQKQHTNDHVVENIVDQALQEIKESQSQVETRPVDVEDIVHIESIIPVEEPVVEAKEEDVLLPVEDVVLSATDEDVVLPAE